MIGAMESRARQAWAWAREHVNLILLLCVLVVVGGVWGFAKIADEVVEGDTQKFDERAILALRRPDDLATPIGPSWLHEVGRDATALGGVFVISLVTLSVAGGTRLSTLTNGVFVFGLYGLAFLGGWVEQLGTLVFGSSSARNVGIVVSLLVPSESLWHLAAYHMQPRIMSDVNLTPFSPASVPSNAMVVWAVLYVAAMLAVAVRLFRTRGL